MAYFIRLQGCSLRCSWCDTKYTWDNSGGKEYSISEMVEQCKPYNHVVVTGGEPLIHEDLHSLLNELMGKGIEIETNGLIYRSDVQQSGVHFNISPKLDFMNDAYKKSLTNWNQYCNNRDFKFVVSDSADFERVYNLVDELKLENVILMPEGVEKEKIIDGTRWLVEEVKKRNLDWRVIPRLHIILYGNKRGI
jgi:7-carboxy-7-deazaguanine synthase